MSGSEVVDVGFEVVQKLPDVSGCVDALITGLVECVRALDVVVTRMKFNRTEGIVKVEQLSVSFLVASCKTHPASAVEVDCRECEVRDGRHDHSPALGRAK